MRQRNVLTLRSCLKKHHSCNKTRCITRSIRVKRKGIFAIWHAIPIIIGVSVIPDAIAIRIRCLIAIERENIRGIRNTVAIVIIIAGVSFTILIRI